MEQQGLPNSIAVLFAGVILGGMVFVALIAAAIFSASPGL